MVKYGQSDGNPNNDKNLTFKSMINENLLNRKPSLLISKIFKNMSVVNDYVVGLSTNQPSRPFTLNLLGQGIIF